MLTHSSPRFHPYHHFAIILPFAISPKKKKKDSVETLSLFFLVPRPSFQQQKTTRSESGILPPQPHFYIFISSSYIHKITCGIVLPSFIFYNCCICLFFFHSHWYVFMIYPFGHMQLEFNLLNFYIIYWNVFICSWTFNLLSLFSILNSMRMNIFL